MKRILIFIFFLLSLFSLCSFYFQKVSEEKEVLQKAITNHSEIVIFSEKNIIAGNKQRKEEIVRAIKKLSASYHVNVYKNDVTNTGNASVLFAKINFNTKKIFKKLQMSIPENQERFKLQSKGLLYSNNEYILKDFNQLTRSNVLSGRYIIQYQKNQLLFLSAKIYKRN